MFRGLISNDLSGVAKMITRLLKARRGLTVLGLKGVEALAGAAMTIYLARTIGPTAFGFFAFGLATTTLLAIPIKKGASTLITKHVAITREDGGVHLAGPLLATSIQLALIYAALVMSVIWGAVVLTGGSNPLITSAALFSLALPFLCLTGLLEGVLRGNFRPNAAILVGTVLVPLVVLTAAAPLSGQIRTQGWMLPAALYVSAAMAISLLSFVWARPYLSDFLTMDVGRRMHAAEWLRDAAPFVVVTGLLVFNRQIDVILLGILLGEEEAGIYRIAAQAAVLVTFGVQAIGHLYAPQLATATAKPGSGEISEYLRKSVIFSVAFGLLALVTLAYSGDEIIALVTGPEYLPSYPAMLILCAANLAVALNGATMQALYMRGHQSHAAWIFAGAGAFSVVANVSLIPLYGTTGAAIATSSAIVLWSLGLRWLACRTWHLSFFTFSISRGV